MLNLLGIKRMEQMAEVAVKMAVLKNQVIVCTACGLAETRCHTKLLFGLRPVRHGIKSAGGLTA